MVEKDTSSKITKKDALSAAGAYVRGKGKQGKIVDISSSLQLGRVRLS